MRIIIILIIIIIIIISILSSGVKIPRVKSIIIITISKQQMTEHSYNGQWRRQRS